MVPNLKLSQTGSATVNGSDFNRLLNQLISQTTTLLPKSNARFGRRYFAQTELLNEPSAGGGVVREYGGMNMDQVLEENNQLKSLINFLMDAIKSPASWLGLGAGVLGAYGLSKGFGQEEVQPEISPQERTEQTQENLKQDVQQTQAARQELEDSQKKTIELERQRIKLEEENKKELERQQQLEAEYKKQIEEAQRKKQVVEQEQQRLNQVEQDKIKQEQILLKAKEEEARKAKEQEEKLKAELEKIEKDKEERRKQLELAEKELQKQREEEEKAKQRLLQLREQEKKSRKEAADATRVIQKPPQQAIEISNDKLRFLSDIISLGESSNNYDVAFGHGRKKNKLISPEQFSGGKKLTEMTLSEVMAFQRKRNSIDENTGAVGKYQFIETTLKGLIQQSGLDPNTTKFTPQVQERLQNDLIMGNVKSLQNREIPVTPINLSLAHSVGAGGLAAIRKAIRNGEGDKSVVEVIKKYTKRDIGKENEYLTKIAAKDFERTQTQRLEQKAKERKIELPSNYFQTELKPQDLQPPSPNPQAEMVKSSTVKPNLIASENTEPDTVVIVEEEDGMNNNQNMIGQTKPAGGLKPRVPAGAIQSSYQNYFAMV